MSDAYTPREMARRVEEAGVAKANLDLVSLLGLAFLAGSFIALGAAFSTVASTQTQLGYGPTRVIAGLTFSLGLVLVVVGGAELFTGNMFIVMAWASGRVTTGALARNWIVAYVGNLAGATATAALLYYAVPNGDVAANARAIAEAKAALEFAPALVRGVFCNVLVCLAVWLTFSARTTADKILCIVGPITAFVAMGLEHSIANMYFLPMGKLLGASLAWGAMARNLAAATLGNMIGGGLMVAGSTGSSTCGNRPNPGIWRFRDRAIRRALIPELRP
jgi:formate/nitrite transporter